MVGEDILSMKPAGHRPALQLCFNRSCKDAILSIEANTRWNTARRSTWCWF